MGGGTGVIARVTWIGGATFVGAVVLTDGLTGVLTEAGDDFGGFGGWCWLLDVGVELGLKIEIGFDAGVRGKGDAGRALLIGCASLTPLLPAIVTPAWTAVATAGLAGVCGLLR